MPPIKIAEIYKIHYELRLKGIEGEKFLVKMTSGVDAVYEYKETDYNPNVDWDWNLYFFQRYAKPEDMNLPRYV